MHTTEHVGLFDYEKKARLAARKQLPLVLASSSVYRQELLQRIQIPFTAASPNVDETAHEDETPIQLVQRLAVAKARALQTQFPEHFIIGSDQVAVCTGQIFGKPGTVEAAVKQLQHCSGRAVTFYTGLALLNSATDELHALTEPYTVYFRDLNEAQIRRYIEKEQPLNCAGSFKSEGLGITLFRRMKGDDPNSLIGLPLIRLVELLERFGVEIP